MERVVSYPRQPGSCWTRASASVLLATLVILIMVSGCSKCVTATTPYIPPEYYNCSETTPQLLCDAYYSRYGNVAEAQYRFYDVFFVFKNVEVTALMFKHIDEGYFWADNLVQCYCLNANDLKRYKIGARIDVVGQDQGVILDVTGLTFKNCIILPAGCVQLPAPGGGGASIPTY